LIRDIEERTKQLKEELDKILKGNKELLENYKVKGIRYDQELLKDFLEEYWLIYPSKNDNEWLVAVPKYINFSVGWLDHTTKGYNIFTINRFTQWLGDIPDFLRKEVHIDEPMKIFVSDGNLVFEKGKEELVKEEFGDKLATIGRGTARIKRGKEFDLIASIIESGSLPFIPRMVEQQDMRSDSGLIKMEGKYEFQKKAWQLFLKTGATGIYWMTGAGKDIFSTFALDSIKVGNLPNLYVSPNLTILEQMKQDYFPKFAPRLLADIASGQLVLSTYQGYEKIKDTEFGLTIFGECHVLPADSFSKLATIKTKYRIGQSATPYREDGRTSYIFALTGFPTGLNWQDLMTLLGKKYHDVNVYIVNNIPEKMALVEQLLDKDRKTLIFVNQIDIGERISDKLGVPFIYGETKNRLQIAKKSKVFVASRVMELGISLKDLEHIIEVDFLFGSRREELQRTGRLLHSDKAKQHDIIFTREEFELYGKRLHGFVEKGFRINLKPMVAGSFRVLKETKGKAKMKSKGETKLLDELFEEGFFVKERTFGEVNEELAKRGISPARLRINASAIHHKLTGMTKQKKIYKVKTESGYKFVHRR